MKGVKQPDQWVEKATALKTLMEIGNPCSADDFAAALGKRKFKMGVDNRAYNILNRLSKQGLVRKIEEQKEVEYELRTRSGETRLVRRPQTHVSWAMTDKGRKRLKRLTGS